MKTVYFVRHGQSEVNVGDHFMPETSTLTAKGREQARFIAERCANLPVQAMIASTMERAQETAGFIAEKLPLKIESSDLFRERLWPEALVGKAQNDPEASRLHDEWADTYYIPNKKVAGTENFDDLKARVGEAMRYLEQRPESELLVVTHGYFMRMAFSRAIFGEDLTIEQFGMITQAIRIHNTGISVLQYSPTEISGTDDKLRKGWWVKVWNDHAHLG